MKIHIKSNFIVPGLENKESMELDQFEISLREFFEELSKKSPDSMEYVDAGAERLDPDDWEVEINGMSYQHYEDGLETVLRDGDTVSIKIRPLGGG